MCRSLVSPRPDTQLWLLTILATSTLATSRAQASTWSPLGLTSMPQIHGECLRSRDNGQQVFLRVDKSPGVVGIS